MIAQNINEFKISFQEILQAQQRIQPFIHKTPILNSEIIDKIAGIKLFFKCENFQKIGAFKFRGAVNAVQQLSQEQAMKGICTHSSGNHAQAVAKIAQIKQIPAYIVMPKNAPKIKKEATLGYDAEILFCEPTLQAREEGIQRVIQEKQAYFIHPYANREVIAGQGTAILEALQALKDEKIDAVMSPIGGGGLMSGTAIATEGFYQSQDLDRIYIYGAEPLGANDAQRSLMQKTHQKQHMMGQPKTICDGLLTTLGEINYHIISEKLDGIYSSSDEAILHAMKLIWSRMKILIEPSSATVLSSVLSEEFQREIKDKKLKSMILILSGGNVDMDYWQLPCV
jgi:threonine dehydratase